MENASTSRGIGQFVIGDHQGAVASRASTTRCTKIEIRRTDGLRRIANLRVKLDPAFAQMFRTRRTQWTYGTARIFRTASNTFPSMSAVSFPVLVF